MKFEAVDKNLGGVLHAGRVANSRNRHGHQEAEHLQGFGIV